MGKMTKTEARELRSLVRSEYGVLKSEISSRRATVTNEIKDELLALDKSRLAVATNKIERLETKAQKFKEKADQELEKIAEKIKKLQKEAETLKEGYAVEAKKLVDEGKKLREELEADGIEVTNVRGAYYNEKGAGVLTIDVSKGVTITVYKELQTEDFKEKFKKAQQLIQKQASEVQSALHREEQNMVRDLTLNTLESDEAVAFFHNMPSVDELIPAPSLKQLSA